MMKTERSIYKETRSFEREVNHTEARINIYFKLKLFISKKNAEIRSARSDGNAAINTSKRVDV